MPKRRPAANAAWIGRDKRKRVIPPAKPAGVDAWLGPRAAHPYCLTQFDAATQSRAAEWRNARPARII